MRIVAVLSWYDEPVDWLRECVASARFCDQLIAVDGPYSAFPGAFEKSTSPPDQIKAIRGVWPGCITHVQSEPWHGEVAKRDFMFQLALSEGADWVFRIDADEIVTGVPNDLREQLTQTAQNVAESMFMYERTPGWPMAESRLRCLFRALPGIGVQGAHSRVMVEVDGKHVMLAGPDLSMCEPAESIADLVMVHRTHERSVERKVRKADYYKLLPSLEK